MAKAKTKPFTMVRRTLWDSRRFASLPDDASRYLYLYVLTCPHQTGTGCFVAKPAYILADLDKAGGDWTANTLCQRLKGLEDAGLILTDADTGELLVTQWWDGNEPSNEKWLTGARAQVERIESTRLRQAANEALQTAWEAHLSAKGLPTLSPRGQGAGSNVLVTTLANRLARA